MSGELLRIRLDPQPAHGRDPTVKLVGTTSPARARVVLDNTPPEVSIISPKGFRTGPDQPLVVHTATPVLAASYTDRTSGVPFEVPGAVRMFLDGTEITARLTIGSGEAFFEIQKTEPLSEGVIHILDVLVMDRAENVGRARVDFIVLVPDHIAPEPFPAKALVRGKVGFPARIENKANLPVPGVAATYVIEEGNGRFEDPFGEVREAKRISGLDGRVGVPFFPGFGPNRVRLSLPDFPNVQAGFFRLRGRVDWKIELRPPPPYIAGTANDLFLQAVDAFGQPVKNYTGVALVTSTDPRSLLANLMVPFFPADLGQRLLRGVAIFFTAAPSIFRPEPHRVTVRDTRDPEIVFEVEVVVKPAAPAQFLAVSGVRDQVIVEGQAPEPAVYQIEDRFGNRVPDRDMEIRHFSRGKLREILLLRTDFAGQVRFEPGPLLGVSEIVASVPLTDLPAIKHRIFVIPPSEAFALVKAATGGVVEVTNPQSPLFGARIEIPPGALAEDTAIFIAHPPFAIPPLPASLRAVGPFAAIGFPFVQFSVPAKLTLPFSPQQMVSLSIPPGTVKPAIFDFATNQWGRRAPTEVFPDQGRLSLFVTDLGPGPEMPDPLIVPVVQIVDPAQTVVRADPPVLIANGRSVSIVTVEPKDLDGFALGPGHDVRVFAILGPPDAPVATPLGVTDLGDNRYQAPFTALQIARRVRIVATVNSVEMATKPEILLRPKINATDPPQKVRQTAPLVIFAEGVTPEAVKQTRLLFFDGLRAIPFEVGVGSLKVTVPEDAPLGPAQITLVVNEIPSDPFPIEILPKEFLRIVAGDGQVGLVGEVLSPVVAELIDPITFRPGAGQPLFFHLPFGARFVAGPLSLGAIISADGKFATVVTDSNGRGSSPAILMESLGEIPVTVRDFGFTATAILRGVSTPQEKAAPPPIVFGPIERFQLLAVGPLDPKPPFTFFVTAISRDAQGNIAQDTQGGVILEGRNALDQSVGSMPFEFEKVNRGVKTVLFQLGLGPARLRVQGIAPPPQLKVGEVLIDNQPPAIVVQRPQESSIVPFSQAQLELSLTDNRIGINPASLKVLYDSQDVTAFVQPVPPEEGRFMATLPARPDGLRQISIELEDFARNSAKRAVTFSIDTTPPTVPTLVSPQVGAFIAQTQPKLDWTDSTDAIAGVASYRVQVAKDSAFTAPLEFESAVGGMPGPGMPPPPGSPPSEILLPVSLAEGPHFWRVNAQDRVNNGSAFSSTGFFTVDVSPPDTLDLSVTPSLSNRDPLVRARAVDTVSPIRGAELFVDTDPGVGKGIPMQAANASFFATEQTFLSVLNISRLTDGEHTVFARSFDFAGNADPTPASAKFTIDRQPPTVPQLLSPKDGAFLKTAQVQLDWSDSQDPSGVASYDVEIARTRDFLPPLVAALTVSVSESAVGPVPEGAHFWRVRARDKVGNVSNFSRAFSFTVDLTGPTVSEVTVDPALTSRNPALSALATDALTPVQKAEFFVDTDPGVGLGKPMIPADGVFDSLSERMRATIDVALLSDGAHSASVRAFDAAGNVSAAVSATFTVDRTLPTVPELLSPADEAFVNTPIVSLDWQDAVDVSGIFGYDVEVAATAEFAAPLEFSATVVASQVTVQGLTEGVHFWRVRARDKVANVSSFSRAFSFTLDLAAPDTKEVAVTPAITNQNPKLTALAFDATTPIAGAEFFVDVDPGQGKGTLLAAADGIFDSKSERLTVTIDISTLSDGAHTVFLRAKDAAGNFDPTPASAVFLVDRLAPSVPVLLSPADQALLNAAMITLDWGDSTDPAPAQGIAASGIDHYEVQVDDSAAFVAPLEFSGEPQVSTFTIVPVPENGHHWRVLAVDRAGNKSAFSASFFFKVDITAPETFNVVITPTVTNRNPTITASAINGKSNIVRVEFFIGVDPGQGKATPLSPADGAFDSVREDVTGTIDISALTDGAHTVFVRAKDAAGNFDPTPFAALLTVDRTPPVTPTLLSPADGGALATATVALDWSDVTDAVRYEMEVASDALLAALEFSATVTLSAVTTAALADGQHFWRVRALDEAGNRSVPSAVFSFLTDTKPPAAPTLLSPADGALLASGAVVLDWTDSADELSGLAFYKVEMDDTAEFLPPLELSLQVIDSTVAALVADGKHFWRVAAVDKAGNASAFSAVFSFSVDTKPPAITSLLPLDGSLLTTRLVTIAATYVDLVSGVDPATGVRLLVDNLDKTSLATVTSTGLEFSIELTEGAHTAVVEVVDRLGNTASGKTSFTIDSFAPTLAFSSPLAGQNFVLPALPTVVLNYSDAGSGMDLATVKILANGTDVTTRFSIGATQATWAVSLSLDGGILAVGINTLEASAKDRAGNLSSAKVQFQLSADPTVVFVPPPEVGSRFKIIPVSPADPTVLREGLINTTGGGFDSSEIAVHVIDQAFFNLPAPGVLVRFAASAGMLFSLRDVTDANGFAGAGYRFSPSPGDATMTISIEGGAPVEPLLLRFRAHLPRVSVFGPREVSEFFPPKVTVGNTALVSVNVLQPTLRGVFDLFLGFLSMPAVTTEVRVEGGIIDALGNFVPTPSALEVSPIRSSGIGRVALFAIRPLSAGAFVLRIRLPQFPQFLGTVARFELEPLQRFSFHQFSEPAVMSEALIPVEGTATYRFPPFLLGQNLELSPQVVAGSGQIGVGGQQLLSPFVVKDPAEIRSKLPDFLKANPESVVVCSARSISSVQLQPVQSDQYRFAGFMQVPATNPQVFYTPRTVPSLEPFIEIIRAIYDTKADIVAECARVQRSPFPPFAFERVFVTESFKDVPLSVRVGTFYVAPPEVFLASPDGQRLDDVPIVSLSQPTAGAEFVIRATAPRTVSQAFGTLSSLNEGSGFLFEFGGAAAPLKLTNLPLTEVSRDSQKIIYQSAPIVTTTDTFLPPTTPSVLTIFSLPGGFLTPEVSTGTGALLAAGSPVTTSGIHLSVDRRVALDIANNFKVKAFYRGGPPLQGRTIDLFGSGTLSQSLVTGSSGEIDAVFSGPVGFSAVRASLRGSPMSSDTKGLMVVPVVVHPALTEFIGASPQLDPERVANLLRDNSNFGKDLVLTWKPLVPDIHFGMPEKSDPLGGQAKYFEGTKTWQIVLGEKITVEGVAAVVLAHELAHVQFDETGASALAILAAAGLRTSGFDNPLDLIQEASIRKAFLRWVEDPNGSKNRLDDLVSFELPSWRAHGRVALDLEKAGFAIPADMTAAGKVTLEDLKNFLEFKYQREAGETLTKLTKPGEGLREFNARWNREKQALLDEIATKLPPSFLTRIVGTHTLSLLITKHERRGK